MSIRKDNRQWLIYDEETVRAVEGAVEIFLMGLGASMLINSEDIALRATGHAGLRVSRTRHELWAGRRGGLAPSEIQIQLAGYLDMILAWMAGEGQRPDDALDEIHAAMVWLDKRARAAGVAGDGWYREAIRETQSGG